MTLPRYTPEERIARREFLKKLGASTTAALMAGAPRPGFGNEGKLVHPEATAGAHPVWT